MYAASDTTLPPEPPGYSIDPEAMIRDLGPYLEYLGGDFLARITQFI